jgi:hypothetical protein
MLFEGDYLTHVDAILTQLKRVRKDMINEKLIKVCPSCQMCITLSFLTVDCVEP